MLALHPSLVASGAAAGDVRDDGDGGRACYCVAVACVSLLLFVLLAAGISVSRAGAIAGVVVFLLLLFGWFAPTGTGSGAPTMRQQVTAAAPAAMRVVHHRCACGLSDAAIASLPSFAYDPPVAKDSGGDGDDGSGKPRGSSVLCAVCLEDVRAGEMVRQLLACRHLFHVECVDAWLRARRTCPLCRREVSLQSATSKQAAAAAATVTEPTAEELPPV